MMSENSELINNIKQQALHVMSGFAFPDVGEVISYDPDNMLAKVQIQAASDDTPAQITGWIPVSSPWVGNGWGIGAALEIGDLVSISYQKGDRNSGFIDGRFFTDNNRPVSSQPKEFNLVHSSGSTIKLKNDGSVEINCPAIVKLGDVSGSLKRLITEEFANLYNEHTHGGSVPVPEKPIDQTCLTQNLKAT